MAEQGKVGGKVGLKILGAAPEAWGPTELFVYVYDYVYEKINLEISVGTQALRPDGCG